MGSCSSRVSLSTSIQTNRYYLRIFCWLLDRVVHVSYVVVCWCGKDGIGGSDWKQYANDQQEGRRDFQIDLGISLLNTAIEWDWTEEDRPRWMRQGPWIPCDCEECYFCLNGYTTGIEHKKQKVETVEYKCGTRLATDRCMEHRVNLGLGGSYCKMCFQSSDNTKGTVAKRKKECNTSRLGCLICKETICKKC